MKKSPLLRTCFVFFVPPPAHDDVLHWAQIKMIMYYLQTISKCYTRTWIDAVRIGCCQIWNWFKLLTFLLLCLNVVFQRAVFCSPYLSVFNFQGTFRSSNFNSSLKVWSSFFCFTHSHLLPYCCLVSRDCFLNPSSYLL